MIEPLASFNTFELLAYFTPKLLAATLVGTVVGIEREIRHKVVGVKTNILICAGSTLFTSISFLLAGSGDPLRGVAQIVSGIGFLGAGAIFKTHDKVQGLTTAAFIWVVAAFGIIIGAGGLFIGVVLSLGLVLIVEALARIDHKVKHHYGKGKQCKPTASLD